LTAKPDAILMTTLKYDGPYQFLLAIKNKKTIQLRHLEYLQAMIHQITAFASATDEEYTQDPIIASETLDNLAHKILLLQKLGVIDFLRTQLGAKNPSLNNGTLAQILSHVIEGFHPDSIRKCLSDDGTSKSTTKTRPALKAVNRVFEELGIKI
jgi:hypothetical protein